jgi:hypothetical protein
VRGLRPGGLLCGEGVGVGDVVEVTGVIVGRGGGCAGGGVVIPRGAGEV